jgi:predicted PurR-regulated permease PerM
MTSADSSRVDKNFLANAMASFIQIAAVVLLIMWCFSIVKPFIGIVVWGMIISIALYPAHLALTEKLGGKAKMSATILVLIGLAIIIVPTWLLAESAIDGLKFVSGELEDGSVHISPPNESVAEWPLVGERVYAVWAAAAENLAETLNRFEPQLRNLSQSAVGFAGGIVAGVFQFIFATIIGGVLLMSAEGGYQVSRNIAKSLVGSESGNKLADLSILTIRSVVKGVLGVAVIQTILAAIGLVAIGMPAAGLFAAAVLVLAIVQLPPILVLGPIAIWYFSVAEGMPATIFLIYALIVSMSDAFLKPMLLGRGVDTPMLVILIGAIGGAITYGIVGLFIGAVVLALGYELFTAWMAPDEAPDVSRKTESVEA